MRALALIPALIPLAIVVACSNSDATKAGKMKLTPGAPPQGSSFSYAAGDDDGGGTTFVVPAGNYISKLWVAGAGTLTITPANPNTVPVCDAGCTDAGYTLNDAGPDADAGYDAGRTYHCTPNACTSTGEPITIPSGGSFTLETNGVLQANANGLSDGTTITVTSSAWAVVLSTY
jgi:hypothetical protein